MSDGSEESKAIRDDIAFTRARMGHELEELGTRLNPGRLAEEGKEKVRNTAVGWALRNPIPAALIAAAAGWIIVRSLRRRPRLQ